MRGKNPTKSQRQYIKKYHLNPENWLVCKNTQEEMLLKHRYSEQYRTIHKVHENG